MAYREPAVDSQLIELTLASSACLCFAALYVERKHRLVSMACKGGYERFRQSIECCQAVALVTAAASIVCDYCS